VRGKIITIKLDEFKYNYAFNLYVNNANDGAWVFIEL